MEATGAWDARRSETDLMLASGDTATVRLDLPVRTRIESLPLHAEVVLVRPDGSEEALGTTPFVVDRADGLDGRLVARLDGYTDAETAAPEAGGRVSLVLRPEGLGADEAVSYSLPTQRHNPRRALLDVGLGAAAIAAGAVAVHYKFRADAADEEYREPGSAAPRRARTPRRRHPLRHALGHRPRRLDGEPGLPRHPPRDPVGQGGRRRQRLGARGVARG